MLRYWIVSLILLLATGGVAAGCWVRHELVTPFYNGSAPETFVQIPRGANAGTIASWLTAAGVLHARYPFILFLRWTGSSRRLQAGEYRFSAPATPIQIADRLARGDVYYLSITVPEGLTARETIQHLARGGLGDISEMELALLRTDWIGDLDARAQSLEGYLFPETYRFGRLASSEDIIRSMVQLFRERFARLVAEHPLQSGWTISNLVTLASMVEKEAKTEAERSLVASVFLNRLNRGMTLASDPTIIYALKLSGKFDGNLRKEDLAISSPYNTYVHPGLPPGPIANPGASSLRAVMSPLSTDYLYFVARNDGTHHFSKDLASHLNAVARYQKALSSSAKPARRPAN